ncbi:MAG: 4'-phosphopantetheinyl transferase superfamily protein [Gemmatimonadaceae bacterium]|nr:4'-phosphopantetheinyl transferase superfamily protein [Gemmatimonadaceae bacterium]
MIVQRYDAIAGWLALILNPDCDTRPSGRDRREADERAAHRARVVALASLGLRGRQAFVSISHTEGSAAALAGVGERLFGVDLVRISRVAPRHSRAILSHSDRVAFGAMPPHCRDALAWALKEAAAKATGAAQHLFPDKVELSVNPRTRHLRVRIADSLRTTFSTDWFVLGDLMCATVFSTAPARLLASKSRPGQARCST